MKLLYQEIVGNLLVVYLRRVCPPLAWPPLASCCCSTVVTGRRWVASPTPTCPTSLQQGTHHMQLSSYWPGTQPFSCLISGILLGTHAQTHTCILCGCRKNPTTVEVSNIPELLQRLRWRLRGKRTPWVNCWRKSPHTTKWLKLLRY